jgi:hypothetical protein
MALENYLIGYGLDPSQARIVMAMIEELKAQNEKIRHLYQS